MDNTLTIDGASVSLFKGATYLDALRRIGAGREQTAVAVLTPGGIRSLSDEAQPGQTVRTIDLSDEEGRRVYERSLRFVFLLAVPLLPIVLLIAFSGSAFYAGLCFEKVFAKYDPSAAPPAPESGEEQ